MKIITGEGIILRKTLYSDADIIYEVLSKNMGKISILGKGILKQSSKNKGLMNLFSHISYEIFSFPPKKSSSFYQLKNASTLTQTDIESFSAQSVCALLSEISLTSSSDTDSSLKTYLLWKDFLYSNIFSHNTALGFLIKFFSLHGLFPLFSQTSEEGIPFLGTEKIFWELEKGLSIGSEGLLHYKYIPFPLLKVFNFALHSPFSVLEKISFSVSQKKEIWDIFWWFYAGHFTYFPRSKKVFEEFVL